jgi:1,4-alpha-glucan branching enzyme
MTHSGGKLNFMGNEIAQFIEWRYYEGIQYFLTEQYESHAHFQHYVAALNHFYNEHPALWQNSYTNEGFEWIDADNSEQSVISFVRKGDDPKDTLVVLINFDVNPHEDFRVGVPMSGYWVEAFNSDSQEFGGSGVTNGDHRFASQETPWNMRDNSVELRLPPLAGLMLRYDGPLPAKKKPATTAKPKAAKTSKASKGATGKPATERAAKPASARGSSSRGAKRASSAKPSVTGTAPAKGKTHASAAKSSRGGAKPGTTGRGKS